MIILRDPTMMATTCCGKGIQDYHLQAYLIVSPQTTQWREASGNLYSKSGRLTCRPNFQSEVTPLAEVLWSPESKVSVCIITNSKICFITLKKQVKFCSMVLFPSHFLGPGHSYPVKFSLHLAVLNSENKPVMGVRQQKDNLPYTC